ncbi:hypothetical protein JCM9957A_55410 [Kineosporia succinea]
MVRRRLLDRLLVKGTVQAAGRRGARWRAVTLGGPDLAGLDGVPGQWVRRQLVGEHGRPRRDVLTKPFWTPGRKGLD